MKSRLTPVVRIGGVLAVVTLSGCASLGSAVGLASQDYVDERVAALEAGVAQNRAAIDEASARLDRFDEVAAQIEESLVAVEQAVTTTEELQQLATILEERLNVLPEETIRQLVEILQQHLDG